MATEVIMPKLTHEMSSGVLERWLVKEGSAVKEGDVLFEVETDKAVSEVTAEASGFLRGVSAEAGSEIAVGKVIAWIADQDEALPVAGVESNPAAQSKPDQSGKEPAAAGQSIPKTEAESGSGRLFATPVARRMAQELGLDLTSLKGSGPRGRIIERDVRDWQASRKSGGAAAAGPAFEDIHLDSKARIMAERMLESATQIPQFSIEMSADMRAVAIQRKKYNENSGRKATMTAVLIRAVASALADHRRLNASYINSGVIRIFNSINIGVALQSPQGLLVPVIRDAQNLDLIQIQIALDSFKAKASANKFSPDDLSGGTFTISNLGMYGVERFNAIINPPQAGILAVGKVMEVPAGIEGGFVFIPRINLCLTADHRFINGADAAQLLSDLVARLEQSQDIFSGI